MAELGWPALEVTQEHLQNLVSQGDMIAVKLATCRVPTDPASLPPVGGYIVACVAFYERGFGVPSHRFLCSLLQFYGLELHHLTPSGILHMVAFMTLCEAYMGIEPHFKCGTISFAPGYVKARTQKQRCWAVWTSLSDPGPELIPTSIF
jgi:hypothetical protein